MGDGSAEDIDKTAWLSLSMCLHELAGVNTSGVIGGTANGTNSRVMSVPSASPLARINPEAYDRVASTQSCEHNQASKPDASLQDPEPLGYAFGSRQGGALLTAAGPWFFVDKSSKDIPYDLRANPERTFSVELCAKCDGGLGHQSPLTSRDRGSGQEFAGYQFFVEPEHTWSFWVGAGARWEKLYGAKVSMGIWTHLRGVVDMEAREVRFYVNHQLAASKLDIAFVPNRRRPMRLGAGQTEGDPKYFFGGGVKDVVILDQDVRDEKMELEDLKVRRDLLDGVTSHCQGGRPALQDILCKPDGGSASFPGSSALSVALQWCAFTAGAAAGLSALPASFDPGTLRSGLAARQDFHELSLQFLQLGHLP